jgi:hypothetical protein
MAKKKLKINSLSELISPQALELLSASGSNLVKQIGMDVVRGVVFDVLTGKNLRYSTEVLTRRRIAALNLATVDLFLKGSAKSDDFVEQLPDLAAEILLRKHLSKTERWLSQWMLGLNDKAFQNILRDDPDGLAEYRDRYINACAEAIATHTQQNGSLKGEIELDNGVKAQVNWLLMAYLLNAIGAQTLAIRGSEKSSYGKLFEKLVLGSLLHILGFKHIKLPPQELDGVFWLSSREERRESDATLLYRAGKGVRFDIGFIGRGNPEISLDKVTRFEREISLGRSTYYMATIILVDRIGANSRIERLAEEVEGTIIQMSAGYWPQQVARVLNKKLGFKHYLVDARLEDIDSYISKALRNVPLEDFIGLTGQFKENFVEDEIGQYSSFNGDVDDQI